MVIWRQGHALVLSDSLEEQVIKLRTTVDGGIICVQRIMCLSFNYFLAHSTFCDLLITFANSLDPDQDPKNISPALDPIRLTF